MLFDNGAQVAIAVDEAQGIVIITILIFEIKPNSLHCLSRVFNAC
jgi:hypothetical protein